MIFGKSKLELKVGIFVFIGLIILTVFVLLIGDFKTMASNYRIDFLFHFVNGIKVGAPVRFAGVDVGEVRHIRIISLPPEKETRVLMTARIRKEARIPADSTVWINTLGLLGEKYIEIMPGKDYSKFAAPGQPMLGNDPVAMHEVGETLKKIAEDLDQAILMIKNKEGTIGKLFYDDTLYTQMLGVSDSAKKLISNSDEFIANLKTEVLSLIADIKSHPWKLFFRTKEKPEKK